MGNKVNPLSFRLPLDKDWRSRWFARNKKDYCQNVLEDNKIRLFLENRLKLAGVVRVQIDRFINKIEITLYVSRPGVVIGRGGRGLELLKKELYKIVSLPNPEKNLELEDIVEVRDSEVSSRLVSQRIAEQLEKRLPHRWVVLKAIERVMNAGAKGIKIILSGRIEGAEISRTETFGDRGKIGTIPSGTLRADVDYAQVPALTRSGYIGVKVWIYKGERK